jgi:hypothetical protein
MRRIILVSFGFLLLLGCGPKRGTGGSVTGTLQYKGQAVNGATLRFYPLSETGPEFAIPVSQDGKFSSSNIPPGEYKVLVEPSQAPPEGREPLIPKGMDPAQAAELKEQYKQAYGAHPPTIPFPGKYQDVEATDLKCTITDGEQTVALELHE